MVLLGCLRSLRRWRRCQLAVCPAAMHALRPSSCFYGKLAAYGLLLCGHGICSSCLVWLQRVLHFVMRSHQAGWKSFNLLGAAVGGRFRPKSSCITYRPGQLTWSICVADAGTVLSPEMLAVITQHMQGLVPALATPAAPAQPPVSAPPPCTAAAAPPCSAASAAPQGGASGESSSSQA